MSGVRQMHDIWNPWHGCHKCSPGCVNCYMYALDAMRGVQESSDVVRLTKSLRYPVQKWRTGEHKGQYKIQSGERIRVNMTSDTFLPEADAWRPEMWDIIRERSDVIFWLLTKRPERIRECLPPDWGEGWENVMLNVTCENQAMANIRIPILLSLSAKHKGICVAPMIGPVSLKEALASGQMEEISVGGENYNNPRPCKLEWVQDVAFECRAYRTNFVFYETGTNFWVAGKQHVIPSKQVQSIAAFCTGLSQHYYDPEYKLTDPVTGEPVVRQKAYQRMFNRYHCFGCANQAMCNGCSGCGNCQKVDRVPEVAFLKEQAGMTCRREMFEPFMF